jgi:hypothetical protein
MPYKKINKIIQSNASRAFVVHDYNIEETRFVMDIGLQKKYFITRRIEI